jgi:hypothetical protein
MATGFDRRGPFLQVFRQVILDRPEVLSFYLPALSFPGVFVCIEG